jgi:hypothetical protein
VRRLAIRPGAIGDFIVSLPAIEHLNTSELWVREAVVPLAAMLWKAQSIAATGLDLMGIEGVEPPGGLLQRLSQFDEIHSWYGSNHPEFRQAVRDLPFRFYPALPDEAGAQHAADFYAAQVGMPAGAVPMISVKTARHGRAVVHPFASGARKQWPLEDFRAVAEMLDAEWCAGPEPGRLRYERLDKLAEWLAGASVYIGNDSGIAHLAAAVGTPCVVLFGPTNPVVWAPRGPAVRVLSPMSQITPEDVVREARLLQAAAANPAIL